MSSDPLEMLPARILVVDDEHQIHASIRLRLGRDHEIAFCYSGHEALAKLTAQRFDLCFADIHMPDMDGLRFIDAARGLDPQLGYVVLSAFDTDDNLRRTIPLQVYDFIPKPLPDRAEFESRIEGWVSITRMRRREHELAQHADTLAGERDSARMERDVELVASESARDALLQTAGLLSTVHAHYVGGCAALSGRVTADPSLVPLLRAMQQGRLAAEAAMDVTERFLGSAYGDRDSSPALLNEGIRDAVNMATRSCSAESLNTVVHFTPLDTQLPLRGLSGIAFLLMILPALAATIALAPPNTTVSIRGERYVRLSDVLNDSKRRSYLWLNRRNALTSHPAWLISFNSISQPMDRAHADLWLRGEFPALATITPRGLVEGIQRCHGLLGFSVPPAKHFQLCLVLPT